MWIARSARSATADCSRPWNTIIIIVLIIILPRRGSWLLAAVTWRPTGRGGVDFARGTIVKRSLVKSTGDRGVYNTDGSLFKISRVLRQGEIVQSSLGPAFVRSYNNNSNVVRGDRGGWQEWIRHGVRGCPGRAARRRSGGRIDLIMSHPVYTLASGLRDDMTRFRRTYVQASVMEGRVRCRLFKNNRIRHPAVYERVING